MNKKAQYCKTVYFPRNDQLINLLSGVYVGVYVIQQAGSNIWKTKDQK